MRSRFLFTLLVLVAAAPRSHGDATGPCDAASNSSCGSCGDCIRICEQTEKDELKKTSPPAYDLWLQVWVDHEERNVSISEHFTVVQDANCSLLGKFSLSPSETFRIFANGSLQLVEDVGVQIRIEPDEYCIKPKAGKEFDVVICGEGTNFITSLIDTQQLVYSILSIIGAIFALLTVVAYFINREPKNLHAWTVLCQAGCLVFVFTGFSITYLTGHDSDIVFCKSITYIIYYFFLASFFWLNVMCIDIFLAFRTVSPHQRMSSFVPFLYAWGTPALFAAVVITLDHTTNDKKYSPRIGSLRCWFQGVASELLYFIGPVVLLLLVNIVLFISTAMRLMEMRREARAAFRNSSRVHNSRSHDPDDKARLTLYVKLFLLMGVTWIMEFVSPFTGEDFFIFYIADAINCMRGLLIFWFCVWSNKNMRRVLLEKICCCCRRRTNELSAELGNRSGNAELSSMNSINTSTSTI